MKIILILLIFFILGILSYFLINFIIEEIFMSYFRNISKKLQRTGYPVERFFLIEGGIILSIIIITFLFLGKGIVLKIFISILFSIPVLILFPKYADIIRNKWLEKFDDQLEEALRLMVGGLKAGLSFFQCLKVIQDEMFPPISIEFKQVNEEISLGLSLDEALLHLQERVPSRELKIFISAVLLQRKTGGPLVEVLSAIADTIKSRRRIKRRINVLTSEGRISAIILISLPFFMLILLRFIHPELFAPLLETIPGVFIILLVIIMDIIAALWIKKIITIEI